MIIFVAVAFAAAWSPFYGVIFVSQVQKNSFLQRSNFLFAMLLTHLFGFLNSCVNPLIYTAMSDRFRRNFKQMIVQFCCCICHHWLNRRDRQRYFDYECDGTGTQREGYVMYKLRKFSMGTSKTSNSPTSGQHIKPIGNLPPHQSEAGEGSTQHPGHSHDTHSGLSYGCTQREKKMESKNSRSFPGKLNCFRDCEIIPLVTKRANSSARYSSVELKRHSSSQDNSGSTVPVRNGALTSTLPADTYICTCSHDKQDTHKQHAPPVRNGTLSDFLPVSDCSSQSGLDFSAQSEICRELVDSRPLSLKYVVKVNLHDEHVRPNNRLRPFVL